MTACAYPTRTLLWITLAVAVFLVMTCPAARVSRSGSTSALDEQRNSQSR